MRRLILLFALIVAPHTAMALNLEACTRTTHPSHGGEAGHRDLGSGWVSWANWWSQEGVFLDIVVADCTKGEALRTRAREERMSARAPFDRRNRVREVLETQLSGSPAFRSLETIAKALDHIGRDTTIAALGTEPCACAAVYPEHRGARAPFTLSAEGSAK